MNSSRVFQLALLISLFAHGAILLRNPNLAFSPKTKTNQAPEIKYINPPKKIKPPPMAQFTKNELNAKLPAQISMRKISLPRSINMNPSLKENPRNLPVMSQTLALKPAISKPDIIAVKKRITLPPVDLDKINNPSYVSYYQIVREKIRRGAYQNYTRTEQGEVYLSFIISNDGFLKEVRVVEERSSSNSYLIETSVKSIRESAPFPNFPKDLDYAQLSFNVVISYEIGE